MGRERCGPRKLGMAQKPQARSHPSATFTYAHGRVLRGRGRLSRSKSGSDGLRPMETAVARPPAGTPWW